MEIKPIIRSKFQKTAGIILIILGIILHLIPLFPAGWIIVIGLELLGIRLLLWDKINNFLSKYKIYHKIKSGGFKKMLFNGIFVSIVLLIVILLFTVIDHFIHGLNDTWGVPDYYFRNKIPFGFLWGIIGLLLAGKFQNIWLKALIVSGVIAITLQTRYFLEGYALSFVLLFLLFHLIILYFLSVGMFKILDKYIIN